MACFHLRLVSPRPTFPFDASAAELALMDEHAAYWQAKAADGEAIAVGPVFDPAGVYGMAIVEVEDEKAAQALADADPVIEADLGFSYRISPIPSIILRR